MRASTAATNQTSRRMHPASIAVCLGLMGCSAGDEPAGQMVPEPLWAEADSLFSRDPFWLGGDGAYSVDLGRGRVLWLFGDSWIDPGGRGNRRYATMVSNSVAIQRGYDPTTAAIDFYWRTSETGSPEAFFAGPDGRRFWPGHGAVVGDRLLLFLMAVSDTDAGLGFEVSGWQAVLIGNPDAEPRDWTIEFVDSPANHRRIVVGSGGVLIEDPFLYAHGSQEPDSHSIFLVRWPLADVAMGNLRSGMQWWSGVEDGWESGGEGAVRALPVLENGPTEFTVHRDPASAGFRLIQTQGFGGAVVVERTSDQLTGPWSAVDTLVVPPQASFPGVMIYQGKAHPYLRGDGLVITYSTNSLDFADQLRHGWLYYPRFARVLGGR